jgi:hypothetical protein
MRTVRRYPQPPDSIDHCNDRKRDRGGDQPVFNRSSTRIVLHQAPYQIPHFNLRGGTIAMGPMSLGFELSYLDAVATNLTGRVGGSGDEKSLKKLQFVEVCGLSDFTPLSCCRSMASIQPPAAGLQISLESRK